MQRTLVFIVPGCKIRHCVAYSTSAGIWYDGQLKFFTALHMTANVRKSNMSTNFRVTNKIHQVSKFKNTEPTSEEDNYILLHNLKEKPLPETKRATLA